MTEAQVYLVLAPPAVSSSWVIYHFWHATHSTILMIKTDFMCYAEKEYYLEMELVTAH